MAVIGVAVALVIGVVTIYYARFGRKQHTFDEGLKRTEVCAGIARFLDVVSQAGQTPQDALTTFNRATESNMVRLLLDEGGRASSQGEGRTCRSRPACTPEGRPDPL